MLEIDFPTMNTSRLIRETCCYSSGRSTVKLFHDVEFRAQLVNNVRTLFGGLAHNCLRRNDKRTVKCSQDFSKVGCFSFIFKYTCDVLEICQNFRNGP